MDTVVVLHLQGEAELEEFRLPSEGLVVPTETNVALEAGCGVVVLTGLCPQ